MGMQELQQYGFRGLDANEKAIEEFVHRGAYIQAYLVGCGMIENLLACLLDTDSEADSMVNRFSELMMRARQVLPKEDHPAEDFEEHIHRIAESRRKFVRSMGRDDALAINRDAQQRFAEVRETLGRCRAWVEKFGPQVDYHEGVVLSRREAGSLEVQELLNFLSGLNSHGLYPPEFVKCNLEKHGLTVTIARLFADRTPTGISLSVTKGDWGRPGISALSLAAAVHELANGKTPDTKYFGRGFQFREILEQIESSLPKKTRKKTK